MFSRSGYSSLDVGGAASSHYGSRSAIGRCIPNPPVFFILGVTSIYDFPIEVQSRQVTDQGSSVQSSSPLQEPNLIGAQKLSTLV
jgi:hypothetical protein